MLKTACLIATLASPTLAQVPDQAGLDRERAFLEEIQGFSNRFERELEKGRKLNDEGRVSEGVTMVATLLPTHLQTPAFWYWAGNMVFDLDPAKAHNLHQRAFEGAPTLFLTQFEWALEEHRAGHHANAAVLYAKCLGEKEDANQVLLSDCLLRSGDASGALKAWKRVNHPRNHIQIEKALSWVYGKPSPYRRRADLLAKASGDPRIWTSIILLDARWDSDWWNQEAMPALLAKDLGNARIALGSNESFKELEALAELLQMENPSQETVGPFLRRHQWILGNRPLPTNTPLAARLVEYTLSLDLMPLKEVNSRFKDELWSRARRGGPGDEDALHALANLLLKQDLDITSVDRLGWDLYHSPSFARSLLVGKEKSLKPDDPDLVRALHDFPLDANIAQIAVSAAERAHRPLRAPLLNLIQAEFTSLETGSGGSYALKDYFRLLESIP